MGNQNSAKFNVLTAKRLFLNGVETLAAVLLGSGEKVDLNGESYGLVLDADADTAIGAPTDDVINIKLNGAEDFRIAANLLTALGGSVIATDTISETTAATGVTVDGLVIKDGIVGVKQAITGDGAITVQNAYVVLSKATAAAITIVAPTAGTQDGLTIEVTTLTAQAHVITSATDGFNAKGSSGTVTFTAAIGNSVTLRADNGHWYTVIKNGVTVA